MLNVKRARLISELCPAESLQVIISVLFPSLTCIRSTFLSIANLIVASWMSVGAVGARGLAEVDGKIRIGLSSWIGGWYVVLFEYIGS